MLRLCLNSLAKKNFEKKYFDKIYIPYAPGDGGGRWVPCFFSQKKID